MERVAGTQLSAPNRGQGEGHSKARAGLAKLCVTRCGWCRRWRRTRAGARLMSEFVQKEPEYVEDVGKLIAYIDEKLPPDWPEWPGGWPDQIEAALLDAVLSPSGRGTGRRTLVYGRRCADTRSSLVMRGRIR